MNEEIIQEVNTILCGLSKDKPWMTAKGLSRKIERRYKKTILPDVIEEVLISHTQLPNRKIRHSSFPSKKVWKLSGHILML